MTKSNLEVVFPNWSLSTISSLKFELRFFEFPGSYKSYSTWENISF